MTRAIENTIFGMFDQIPGEWKNHKMMKISSHLRSVRNHAAAVGKVFNALCTTHYQRLSAMFDSIDGDHFSESMMQRA